MEVQEFVLWPQNTTGTVCSVKAEQPFRHNSTSEAIDTRGTLTPSVDARAGAPYRHRPGPRRRNTTRSDDPATAPPSPLPFTAQPTLATLRGTRARARQPPTRLNGRQVVRRRGGTHRRVLGGVPRGSATREGRQARLVPVRGEAVYRQVVLHFAVDPLSCWVLRGWPLSGVRGRPRQGVQGTGPRSVSCGRPPVGGRAGGPGRARGPHGRVVTAAAPCSAAPAGAGGGSPAQAGQGSSSVRWRGVRFAFCGWDVSGGCQDVAMTLTTTVPRLALVRRDHLARPGHSHDLGLDADVGPERIGHRAGRRLVYLWRGPLGVAWPHRPVAPPRSPAEPSRPRGCGQRNNSPGPLPR